MHKFFSTQKFAQIFVKKFSQFFSHPKFFANNFAKNWSNIFNPKICANNWAKMCVFWETAIFWNLGKNLQIFSTIIFVVKYWLFLGSNHKKFSFAVVNHLSTRMEKTKLLQRLYQCSLPPLPMPFSEMDTFVWKQLTPGELITMHNRPVHKILFLEFPKYPGRFMLHFDI